ncbi:MAG: aminodeoxychorismate lyase [Pseudomonadota bacterium]|nr:aminodeoxychorismate lyase [Pseudomonadota bacterium]
MNRTKFNVYINKKTIPWNDRGFNYGDGVFETILIKNNQPIYLKDHIKRMHAGCSALKILKPKEALIKKSIQSCIGKTNQCVVKVILTRGVSNFGYKIQPDITPNIYFFKIKLRKSIIGEKIKLSFSKYHLKDNSQLSKIKHLGRLEQVFVANNLQQQKRFNDLIVCDERNNIIECLSSNIFFIKIIGEKFIFYTPKINACGIEGIMRNKIIKYLRSANLNINIIEINKKKFNLYDSCFTTNSIQGLNFIDQIDKKKFSKPKLLYNKLKRFIYLNKND